MSDQTVIVEGPSPTTEASLENGTATEAAVAAEAAVIAAQTVSTVAAGEVAIAQQQAAMATQEAAQTVLDATAQIDNHDRSIEALWRIVEALPSMMMERIREELPSLIPQPSQTVVEEQEPIAATEATTENGSETLTVVSPEVPAEGVSDRRAGESQGEAAEA